MDTITGLHMRFEHSNGQIVTLSNPDADMDFETFLSSLRAFAVACGYLETSINEIFGEI